MRVAATRFVKATTPIPPLTFEALKVEADKLIANENFDPLFRDYLAILINNFAWKDILATIPYNRRLLLLPKCLRIEEHCPAPFDEFGLLCKECGLCSIQDLQVEAEKLGYAVLVAEGSTLVMSIIETGKIEAIVGVSCMSVLEKAFGYMEAAAIPGVAIPLLQDDCINTTVDMEWVWELIHLTSEDRTHRLDLEGLRETVDSWFTTESLEKIMGPTVNSCDTQARDWLCRAGKRWRPFLSACTYTVLAEVDPTQIPEDFKKIAVAVECFHKASLIHDDIEDGDDLRYGMKTLHMESGVAVALNIGDLLIGEGYRLIAECDASAEAICEMIRIAADGHRTLSLGQGAELAWQESPGPLKSTEILDIFQKKTAPAFEVALRVGAAYAGTDENIHNVLTQYSRSMGIAYQIMDDIDDNKEEAEASDIASARPSIFLSIAGERAKGEQSDIISSVWDPNKETPTEAVLAVYADLKIDDRVQGLLEAYKEEAIRHLSDLSHPSLKGLLRRVMGKIFNDLQVKGWCHEFEAGNAPSGTPVSETTG